ncbi:hypothetical protein QE392_002339 [Microbacterium proteolyticum]|nr:hypothetical protein [Microbacterium sp. SORGH_AS_0344]MDQ1170535.1 hypothetical protein [Microbacterium proteolyticum]
MNMSTTVAQAPDIAEQAQWLRDQAETVEKVRPAWADEEQTYVDMHYGTASALRFSVAIGAVEVMQWADIQDDGSIVVVDEPRIGAWCVVALDELSLSGAAQVGADLARAQQWVLAATGQPYDAMKLTLGDISRLRQRTELARAEVTA